MVTMSHSRRHQYRAVCIDILVDNRSVVTLHRSCDSTSTSHLYLNILHESMRHDPAFEQVLRDS